jgi:hypothetical protein
MKLKSPYSPKKIVEILKEQIDKYPSFIWSIIPFSTRYFRGTSNVCGTVSDSEFVLRNRIVPYYSLIAEGKISKALKGRRSNCIFQAINCSND